jgi:hypothetical protein
MNILTLIRMAFWITSSGWPVVQKIPIDTRVTRGGIGRGLGGCYFRDSSIASKVFLQSHSVLTLKLIFFQISLLYAVFKNISMLKIRCLTLSRRISRFGSGSTKLHVLQLHLSSALPCGRAELYTYHVVSNSSLTFKFIFICNHFSNLGDVE